MRKNIVVLSASPRLGGNTDILSDSFISGAEQAGHQVTKIRVANRSIGGCIDCKHCFQVPGVCSQEDDMTEIYSYLYKADVIVLTTPVYYFGMAAQLKVVIDRLFATFHKSLPISGCVLLSVYGDTNTAVVEPLIAHYNCLALNMGWNDLGKVIVSGTEEKGSIVGHHSLVEARELGLSL